jgi:hypothetical protein
MNGYLPLARASFQRMHNLSGATAGPRVEGSDRLLTWARHHRVAGLLRAGGAGSGQALASAAYGQAVHSSTLAGEAGRLFRILAPEVPGLALVKGPVLAAQAWPDPGLRSFDDLDFLCDPRGLDPLLSAMREAGYAPVDADPRRVHPLWRFGWGLAFAHPDGHDVEVHPRFFPPHYPWPRHLAGPPGPGFREELLDGAPVLAPTPELHLLLSALHAAWHGWSRLGWLADLAGLLVRHPGLESRAQDLAGTPAFGRRVLAASCALARAVFGTDAADEWMTGVLDRLDGIRPEPGGAELRRLHEQFMTNVERASYRIRRICIPGDGDFRRFRLPPALCGLYWILRPLRTVLPGAIAR